MTASELVTRAVADGNFAILADNVPYMRTLGIGVRQVGSSIIVTLDAAERHVGNPWAQALHGGVIGGLLETAAIVQLTFEQRGNKLPKPINVTVDYLRSGRVTETHARATVTRLGKRVANVHASCWQHDPAKPIATLSGHFLVG